MNRNLLGAKFWQYFGLGGAILAFLPAAIQLTFNWLEGCAENCIFGWASGVWFYLLVGTPVFLTSAIIALSATLVLIKKNA